MIKKGITAKPRAFIAIKVSPEVHCAWDRKRGLSKTRSCEINYAPIQLCQGCSKLQWMLVKLLVHGTLSEEIYMVIPEGVTALWPSLETRLPERGESFSTQDCTTNYEERAQCALYLYQSAAGSINWVTICTRPDLLFKVSVLSNT